jgi:hypothetical protein
MKEQGLVGPVLFWVDHGASGFRKTLIEQWQMPVSEEKPSFCTEPAFQGKDDP